MEDLTELFPDRPKRRGRPTAISHAQLHNRREQLVQIFEGEWHEIDLELPRCKKADDLIRIFKPLAESPSWIAGVVELFARRSSDAASNAAMRKVQFERGKLVEPTKKTDESKRHAADQLLRVNWALTQATGRSRRIVKQARKQARKQLWKTTEKWRILTTLERDLELRLRRLEASFARQELVRFIRSKRYEVTPVTLANAAAGLPYIGWRQSMRLCTRVQSAAANGRSIQIFKSIRYLAEGLKKKSKIAIVRSFKENIRLLPSRYRDAKAELAENWLYLDRAIRQSYRLKIRRKAVPHEITKRYFKQVTSRSPVDIVLAQQARIVLSKSKVALPDPESW